MTTITSTVWNNVAYNILTDHAEEAVWDSTYPDPCTMYAYARAYGMGLCQHPGLDISMPHGTPIYAAKAGYISWIRNAGIPNSMEVRVTDNLGHEHLYTHFSSSAVVETQTVTAGQLLGYSGTANSPHLHFEHRIPDSSLSAGWRCIDPKPLLTGAVAPPVTPPPSTGFAVDDKLYVTNGPLNIRPTAGTSGTPLGSIPTNADMCVVGGPTVAGGYTWYQIKYGTIIGWVASTFVALRTAQGCAVVTPPVTPPPSTGLAIGDKIYNNTSSGNIVRSNAGSTNAQVGILAANADACIVGGPTQISGVNWWQINFGSVTGWCVQTYIALRTAQGCVVTTPPPTDPPPTTTTWTHKVSPSTLNFRQTASTSGTLIGALQVNDRVQWLKNSSGAYITTTAGGYTWCNVKSERHGVTGWCVNGLVTL